MSPSVITHPHLEHPRDFTRGNVGWQPWLEPLTEADLTDEHRERVDPSRLKGAYFRLLARDLDALVARTKTDIDIFYNTKGGLGRAERELSAAATSRFNGCVFCASVHARFAAHQSKRVDDVDRLLEEGVDAEQEPLWRAIIEASVALARTPSALTEHHIQALRDAGLDDLAISDAIHGAAFFNWANRLMLSLGVAEEPAA
jgi:alkylhydroperoxidase domain protein